jgi:hypothetical protein
MSAPPTPDSLAPARDDGPLAQLLGRALGPHLPVPAAALTLASAAPLVVAVAVGGAYVSQAALAPGVAAVVLISGAAGGRPVGRFDWTIPAMLRALEYGLLLWTAVLARGPAVRPCFALLAVLAYHHYDSVYRSRNRGEAPPGWLRRAAGGWEGRVILGYLALLLAVSTAAMAVAAVLLGLLFVGESLVGWLAAARAPRPLAYADEEGRDE